MRPLLKLGESVPTNTSPAFQVLLPSALFPIRVASFLSRTVLWDESDADRGSGALAIDQYGQTNVIISKLSKG